MRSLFLILLLLAAGCKSTSEPDPNFNSLLNNLTPTTNETVKKPIQKGALTETEIQTLMHQLRGCWNPQHTPKERLVKPVAIETVIDKNGFIQSAKVLDMELYYKDWDFRVAADGAMRALRNSRCTPLKLPPEKYETWKKSVILFDPLTML